MFLSEVSLPDVDRVESGMEELESEINSLL